MADEFARVREIQQTVAEMNVRHYHKLMALAGVTTSITLHEAPAIDDYGTITMGEWKGYLIQILPMVFNMRIVMTPKDCQGVYDYGWCFDKGPAAFLALAVWDPETEAEPPGYKKRACGLRQAGEDVAHGMSVGAATVSARWGDLLQDVATDSAS